MSRHRLRSLSHHGSPLDGGEEPRAVALARRARRHNLRGERRQAMLALEEACCLSARDPRLWTLYAASCWRMRRYDAAAHGLRQAIFLRARDEDRRVQVLRELLSAVEGGGAPRAVIAA